MLKEASLSFLEHSIDSYLSTIEHLYAHNQRSFLIRPCSPETKAIIESARARLGTSIQFFRDGQDISDSDWGNLPTCDSLANVDAIFLMESRGNALSTLLMSYLDNPGRIIASISDYYFKNRGLFITTIPKSGTHLLLTLLSLFGYEPGGEYIDQVIPGRWYYLANTLGPHCTLREFYTHLRFQPKGGIFHPFFWTPAIFLYRHPLDLAVSESHYMIKPENSVWAHYYRGFSKSEVLTNLLGKKGGSLDIHEYMMVYSLWLRLYNVIPISYEEIVGPEGSGSSEEQLKTIWSLQLKLHIPMKPIDYSEKIYNEKSRTFRRGKIHSYLSEFEKNHFSYVKKLPNDFLEIFGYSLDPAPNDIIPKRVAEFRSRPLIIPEELNDMLFSPEMIQGYFYYNIIHMGKNYYGIPQNLGEIDIKKSMVEYPDRIITGGTIEEVKNKINQELEKPENIYPQLLESYSSYNIILWGKKYYGVPQALGEIDIKKDFRHFEKEILVRDSGKEVKDSIIKKLQKQH